MMNPPPSPLQITSGNPAGTPRQNSCPYCALQRQTLKKPFPPSPVSQNVSIRLCVYPNVRPSISLLAILVTPSLFVVLWYSTVYQMTSRSLFGTFRAKLFFFFYTTGRFLKHFLLSVLSFTLPRCPFFFTSILFPLGGGGMGVPRFSVLPYHTL